MKDFNSALRILLSHDTYLRPGDVAELRWENLHASQPSLGPGAEHWAIVAHPAESGRPSKIGVYDDGV
eukprot:12410462-Karenia_brevis.AAC.1